MLLWFLYLKFICASLIPFLATGVPLVLVFLLGLLALAIDAAYAFRAEEMPSLISCRMAAKVMAALRGYGMIHEDGDNDAISGNDDERAIRLKKYRGSNSSDGGNTGDGVKIVGGVIGFSDEI
ncbi:hypothetical protein Tco_0715475, partial [Tanacetum coccineum]